MQQENKPPVYSVIKGLTILVEIHILDIMVELNYCNKFEEWRSHWKLNVLLE